MKHHADDKILNKPKKNAKTRILGLLAKLKHDIYVITHKRQIEKEEEEKNQILWAEEEEKEYAKSVKSFAHIQYLLQLSRNANPEGHKHIEIEEARRANYCQKCFEKEYIKCLP